MMLQGSVKISLYSMTLTNSGFRAGLSADSFGKLLRGVRDPVHQGTYSPTSLIHFGVISKLMEEYLPEPLEEC